MKSRSRMALVVCLTAAAAFAPAAALARSVALVVGNGGYTALPRLANPAHDARLVADRLAALGFEVTQVVDAPGTELLDALDGFREAARGADSALFYFAGHGVQVGGTNYLLPVDASVADVADLASQAFDVDRVIEAIRDAQPDAAVVILDACRDNPLPSRVEREGVSGTALTSGLARVQGVSGVLIAYATAPGQVAFDGTDGNSPFASALVQQLAEPGLEVSLLFRQVRQRVMEMTGGAQIPWVEEALLQPLYLHPEDPEPPTEVAVLNATLAAEADPTVQLAAVAALASTTEDEALRPVLDERIARLRELRYQGLVAEAQSPGKTVSDWMAVQLLAPTPGGPLAAAAFLVLHAGSDYAAEAQALAAVEQSRGLSLGPPEQARLWDLVGRTEDSSLIGRFLDIVPSGDLAEQAEATQQVLALGAAGRPDPSELTAEPVTSASGIGGVITVFVGTGGASVPLPGSPADIVVQSLPQQGVLTAELADGTTRTLSAETLGEPIKVASLVYTPDPATRDLIDTFAVAPGESRGLILEDAGGEEGVEVAEAETGQGAVTVHADVRVHDCDLLAGARFDTQGVVVGNYPNEIDPARAIEACRQAVEAFPDVPRFRFELARALTADGQHDAAFPLYVEAGQAGYAMALNSVGYAYQQGQGVARDEDTALDYFRSALEYGNLYAANNLGIAYRDGIGVPRNPARAEDYFIQAASGGHTFAYNNLGTMYLNGDGVEASPEAAYRLFRASADAGDIYGYNNLGLIYQRGVFVTADATEAQSWYEKAAAGGQSQAPINLGLLYLNGDGQNADPRQAAYWFAEAARLGNAWGYANLGWMFQSGQGMDADPAAAAAMYARAVALGFPGDAVAEARAGFADLPRADAVREVQSRLAARGYDVGTADGQWGRRTTAAATAFLAERGVTADPTDTLAVLGALLLADDAG